MPLAPAYSYKVGETKSGKCVSENLQVESQLESKWCKSANLLLHNGHVWQHEDHIFLVT